MVRRRSAGRFAGLFAALVAIAITMWSQRGERPGGEAHQAPSAPTQSRQSDVPSPTTTPVSPRTDATPPDDAAARLDGAVRSDDEKRAVIETLARIEGGGPFPYRKDGSVFSNRERRLPAKPRGYYREYTVPTAGEDDRGARRIVTGSDGEAYYTRDHYGTFVRIDQ